MGLLIDRHYGESVTLVFPDDRELTIERSETPAGDKLVCHQSMRKDRPVFLWAKHMEFDTTIGVDANVSIHYRRSKQGTTQACLDINAPADVIISRTEQMRTVDDRLKEVMG